MSDSAVHHINLWSYVDPTTNGGLQNGSSVGTCPHSLHVFAHLAPICMLSRCLLTKNSASELCQRSILKCAAGWGGNLNCNIPATMQKKASAGIFTQDQEPLSFFFSALHNFTTTLISWCHFFSCSSSVAWIITHCYYFVLNTLSCDPLSTWQSTLG